MKRLFSLALLSLSYSVFAYPHIEVKNAFIRLPPSGVDTTALYMDIKNLEKKERILLGFKGPISESIELHEMKMNAGSMSMRKLEKIVLKKGLTTQLKSGGLHAMVFKIRRALKEKERYPIILLLDQGEKIQTMATVKKSP